MRIRTGFVSNSSSTSFMIYGCTFAEEQENILKAVPSVAEAMEEDGGVEWLGEYLWGIEFPGSLKIEMFIDNGYPRYYFGSDPRTWPDQMTIGESKAEVARILREVFGAENTPPMEWIKRTIQN